VPFRSLADEQGLHYSEEQVRALAAEYELPFRGAPDARPGIPADYFPPPFANEEEARASNSGAYPPDLSLMAKARAVERGFPTFLFDILTQYQEGGPNYIYSLLTGYEEPPEGVEIPPGQYYNPYFVSGHSIAMPIAGQLVDGRVSYPQNDDETTVNDIPETVDQYARDVSAFLMWAAEPHLANRKAMGLTVMLFLVILAGLVYYTKKKVWAYVPGEGAA
jgi:ubiquinol-cytochrome c reductase cytochrome c1 subunit